MGRAEETDEQVCISNHGLDFIHHHNRPVLSRSHPHIYRPTTGVGDGEDEGLLLSSRSQAS